MKYRINKPWQKSVHLKPFFNSSNMIIMKFDICLHIKEDMFMHYVFMKKNDQLTKSYCDGTPTSVQVSSESVSVSDSDTNRLSGCKQLFFSFTKTALLCDIVFQWINSLTPAGARRMSPLTAETTDLHTSPTCIKVCLWWNDAAWYKKHRSDQIVFPESDLTALIFYLHVTEHGMSCEQGGGGAGGLVSAAGSAKNHSFCCCKHG